MRTKKLAFVSDAVLPFNKGGKETRIDQLCRELLRQGYEIHIFTMKWWDGPKHIELNGMYYHALSRLYPLYNGERRSIKQGLLFGIACLGLIRYDFDIIEVDHMPFFPIYFTKLVCLIKRRPLYATWHEVWGRKYWAEYLGRRQAIIAYLIERVSVLLPNHIAAVSKHTADQLRAELNYRGPLTLVSNGIDYFSIAPIKAASRQSDVIFTGRLLAHKNVDLLIKAIGELVATRPKISCLIIGDGPEAPALAALITSLGLQDNITMLGRIEEHADVFSYMKSARVFVLPSEREGFGITVLEAWACGLSVVTTDSPHNAAQYLLTPEIGLVCRPTILALSEAISSLLETPLAIDGRQAQSYDWGQAAATLSGVYSA